MATDCSTEGMPAYPKAAPPSRVVRGEELQDLFRAARLRSERMMLLCSRCDQRQLDAIIACQCPLARLVTLEVDWSLWRDPNFVGHPT